MSDRHRSYDTADRPRDRTGIWVAIIVLTLVLAGSLFFGLTENGDRTSTASRVPTGPATTGSAPTGAPAGQR
jgi:hypothetical protein